MGRKLDALLGRNFKTSKFKALTKLAISRTAVLKNQRQSRHHHAMSDVVELLKLGHHERALLHVEHVIKDRNMVDVFVMIENYCHLVAENAVLFEKHKECPDELQEAVSSLIFASSRCGEFPELLKIRAIFHSRFGKEFVARAVELRNNCGVNPKIIQKLSARQSSLEIRTKALTEIASENGIILQIEEEAPVVAKGTQQVGQIPHIIPTERYFEESFSESLKLRKKYTNFAAAALDAFESAAYAAEAARAAVKLSRSKSQDGDQGNGSGSGHHWATMGRYEEVYPIAHVNSESEGEHTSANWGRISSKDKEMSRKKAGMQQISSTESSDSEMNLPYEEVLMTNVAHHDDTELGRNDYAKQTVQKNVQLTRYPTAPEEDWFNSNRKNGFPSHDIGAGNPVSDEANYAADLGNQPALKLHIKPISVRTRRIRAN